MSVHRCLIAVGGNVGESAQVFARAFDLMNAGGLAVQAVSSVFRTEPVGENAGAPFSNAAVIITADQPAETVLRRLHQIEATLGRVRTVHWGPRTIDLDLLLYDDLVIDTPQVMIPHPHVWYRRFVLAPAAEIAADWCHPLLNATIGRLYHRIQQRPVTIELQGFSSKDVGRLCQAAVDRNWPVTFIERHRDARLSPAAMTGGVAALDDIRPKPEFATRPAVDDQNRHMTTDNATLRLLAAVNANPVAEQTQPPHEAPYCLSIHCAEDSDAVLVQVTNVVNAILG